MRWLILNTDDQRRFRAVAGSGESRSMTAWMWCSSGARPASKPCAISPAAGAAVDSSGGTSIDIR
jgi:hypothetical protein